MKKIINVFIGVSILLMCIVASAETIETNNIYSNVPNISTEILSDELYITEATSLVDSDLEEENPLERSDNNFSDNDVSQTGNDSVSLLSLEDSWNESMRFDSGIADTELVVIKDELYAIGGISPNGYLHTIQKYNSESKAWEITTTIPHQPKGYATVVNEDKIYIIGGYADGIYLNSVQVYNTSSGEWSNLISMNERRDEAAALYLDNKIYVFGGRNALECLWSYEYFNFETEVWTLVMVEWDNSLTRVGAQAKCVDGCIYMYGGYNWQGENYGVDIYSTDNFKLIQNLISEPCDDISIVWGENKGLVIRNDVSSNQATVEEIISEDGVATLYNVEFTDNEKKGKYSKYIIYDGYLYCAGGFKVSTKAYVTKVYRYSVYYGDYSGNDVSIVNTNTQSGNYITMNVDTGREYTIFINTNNMTTFDGYNFNISYPEDTFNVVDGCAMTPKKDGLGVVDDTNIEILEISNSGISFKSKEDNPEGRTVNKTVNAIILKATSPGQRTITYTMTRDEEVNE